MIWLNNFLRIEIKYETSYVLYPFLPPSAWVKEIQFHVMHVVVAFLKCVRFSNRNINFSSQKIKCLKYFLKKKIEFISHNLVPPPHHIYTPTDPCSITKKNKMRKRRHTEQEREPKKTEMMIKCHICVEHVRKWTWISVPIILGCLFPSIYFLR